MDFIIEPQPKVFVGMNRELYFLSRENNWNLTEIIVINSSELMYKLHGLNIKKEDVYYGETICLFPTSQALTIFEELKILLRR